MFYQNTNQVKEMNLHSLQKTVPKDCLLQSAFELSGHQIGFSDRNLTGFRTSKPFTSIKSAKNVYLYLSSDPLRRKGPIQMKRSRFKNRELNHSASGISMERGMFKIQRLSTRWAS